MNVIGSGDGDGAHLHGDRHALRGGAGARDEDRRALLRQPGHQRHLHDRHLHPILPARPRPLGRAHPQPQGYRQKVPLLVVRDRRRQRAAIRLCDDRLRYHVLAASGLRSFRLFRILRLAKLVRMLRASRIIQQWQNAIDLSSSEMSLLEILLAYSIFVHWFACLWAMLPASLWKPAQRPRL